MRRENHRPTTGAEIRRRLLPLGGAEGYKGTGLAAIVEIMSGLLTGLGFGVEPRGGTMMVVLLRCSRYLRSATWRHSSRK